MNKGKKKRTNSNRVMQDKKQKKNYRNQETPFQLKDTY
jgi:hypothetical protein